MDGIESNDPAGDSVRLLKLEWLHRLSCSQRRANTIEHGFCQTLQRSAARCSVSLFSAAGSGELQLRSEIASGPIAGTSGEEIT
jgi:hypothetical protein